MVMKKLINHPDCVVDELIEGYVLANPKLVRRHPRVNAIIRADAPVADKVGSRVLRVVKVQMEQSKPLSRLVILGVLCSV